MHLKATQRRRRRDGGFTIMEILIAIVILVIGITGIVALFPTAIESGNKTVEDTIAASTTQSVMDAIAVGIRESRFTVSGTNNRIWSYFVFQHDGVADPPAVDPSDFTALDVHGADWCVLLPAKSITNQTANTTANDEPVYFYPRPGPGGATGTIAADNGGGDPEGALSNLTNLGNAQPDEYIETFDSQPAPLERFEYEFQRVYHLGREPGTTAPGYRGGGERDVLNIREEFLDPQTLPRTADSIIVDPYPQYSFAFSVQRAKIDTGGNGAIDGTDEFSSSLFEVRIYIFRNFQVQADGTPLRIGGNRIPKQNEAIHKFITLISI